MGSRPEAGKICLTLSLSLGSTMAEHARGVGSAILDSVPVTLPSVRESDGGVLAGGGGDRVDVGAARVAGEVDGALSVVQGPEGNAGSAGESRGGNESSNRGSETHFDGLFA
jgi:hypothetical protein